MVEFRLSDQSHAILISPLYNLPSRVYVLHYYIYTLRNPRQRVETLHSHYHNLKMPIMPARAESFDQLLRKGPLNGGLLSGLDELRYKILIDGIPGNNDGMVNLLFSKTTKQLLMGPYSPSCAYTSG